MRPRRAANRLTLRLLAFNLLLIFIPIAGLFYLGAYETRLEQAEITSLTDEAHLLANALANEPGPNPSTAGSLVRMWNGAARLRVIDPSGNVVADSHAGIGDPAPSSTGSPRHNTLYRIGAFLVGPFVKLLQPPEAPLEFDSYDRAHQLQGKEVQSALAGHDGLDKKISAGNRRSVTIYRAVPIVHAGKVTGAVLASESTYPILHELYLLRLAALRIFLASLAVAIGVSIFYTVTIVRPLRQLRVDARSILDRRTGAQRHFKGSRRRDELGELSRALERIVRRLDSHVKIVEAFASDVSHEFKNPLASIRTANEMLAEVSEEADRRRFTRMVDQEVARLERLLSGVREISNINAGLPQEERQPVAITPLISQIVDAFRLRERGRVSYVLDGAEGLMVNATEDRLLQAFENLLDNASSFAPAGSSVLITTTMDAGYVIVRIADEGTGVPDAHLARIFERFFTYRPAQDRRDARHTGLGLAIVRSIIEGYGGFISVRNREPHGAEFEVRLPAS